MVKAVKDVMVYT